MSEPSPGWGPPSGPAWTAPVGAPAGSPVGAPEPRLIAGPGGRPSKGRLAALAAFVLTLALVVAGSLIHVPYAILSPGPIVNTLDREPLPGSDQPLIVLGEPAKEATGSLDFTTVSVSGGPGYPVDVWELVGAWLDGSREVFPVDEIFDPTATSEQLDEENAVQMAGSQQEATAVALRAAGMTVPTFITVATVVEGAPAAGVLKQGDRIVRVGEKTITEPGQVRDAVQAVTPGQPVAMTVLRDGKELTVNVPTRAGDTGKAVVGVVMGLNHDFPVKVTINAGDVGGPSAGLMFSLGIYDLVTTGALTGGKSFAGTGTISEDGSVGPIGGIRQKLVGAQRGGADYFLAPADNCGEVRGHTPDGLTVIKVTSFEDARSSVEKVAAGQTMGLPAC